MKFENTKVYNIARAIYSARNPLESWAKSDSDLEKDILGEKDLSLAKRLIKAGTEHRKFLRQIFISVDITAPLYFFKEFDTYKIGTTSNSTSTMHKLASTPITKECFEMGDYECLDDLGDMKVDGHLVVFKSSSIYWKENIKYMEAIRQKYIETKDKKYWKELIRVLPESWLQKRTITMNYENVLNMYLQRKNHKLTEWSVDFIQWAESLPYFKELF